MVDPFDIPITPVKCDAYVFKWVSINPALSCSIEIFNDVV